MNRLSCVVVLLLASLLNPGCVEAELSTTLKANGSGTFQAQSEFKEKFRLAFHRLARLAPDEDMIAEVKKALVSFPGEEKFKALEKLGLTVASAGHEMTEKKMGSHYTVKFARLDSLLHLDQLDPSLAEQKAVLEYRLTRDEEGIYTLRLDLPDTSKGLGEAMEEAVEEAEEEGDTESTPEEEEAIAEILGLMLKEAMEFKMVLSLGVPGEIVDFSHPTVGKQDESRVTWSLTFESIMELAMTAVMDAMKKGLPREEAMAAGRRFQVRFRMAEGKSLPESALWKEPAPKADETADETGGNNKDEPAEPEKK